MPKPTKLRAFGIQYKSESSPTWQWAPDYMQRETTAPVSEYAYILALGIQTLAWATGKEASAVAEFQTSTVGHAGYTWRVCPLPDDAQINGKPAGEYFAELSTWITRETERMASGDYIALPWAGQGWFDRAHDQLRHFAHVSKQNPKKITYTEDATKGAADRQSSPMNVGRYFERFRAEYYLDAPRIAELAAEYGFKYGEDEIKLEIAMTPDEIEAAYTSGEQKDDGHYSPASCMSFGPEAYEGKCHPVRAYGAGDLGIAFIRDPDDKDHITARCLVWPAKKTYGRFYGSSYRLRAMLHKAGYETDGYDEGQGNGFNGARMLLIPDRDGIILPYLDGPAQVYVEGKYVIIGSGQRGSTLTAGSTDGVVQTNQYCEDSEDRGTCAHCGRREDLDDMSTVNGSLWCDRCVANDSSYCEHCEENTTEGTVTVIVSASGTEQEWCSDCRGDGATFTCAHDDNVYGSDLQSDVEIDEGSVAECNADQYFYCGLNEEWRPLGEAAGWIDGEPVTQDAIDQLRTEGDESLARLETPAERAEATERQMALDLSAIPIPSPADAAMIAIAAADEAERRIEAEMLLGVAYGASPAQTATEVMARQDAAANGVGLTMESFRAAQRAIEAAFYEPQVMWGMPNAPMDYYQREMRMVRGPVPPIAVEREFTYMGNPSRGCGCSVCREIFTNEGRS